jgi:hypothetical protein
MGLRKFCRTLVSEAKAAMPELETGDPLVGVTIEEDAAGFGGFAGNSNTAEPALGAPPPPHVRSVDPGVSSGPVSRTSSGAIARNTGPTGGASGPISGPRSFGNSTPRSIADAASGPIDPEVEEASGGGAIKMVVAGFVAFVVAVIFVTVAVAAVAAVFVASGPGSPDEPAPKPVPTQPAPAPTAPKPAPPAPTGGQIVSPDTRSGAAKAKVTLSYSDPAGAKVTVKNGNGFHGEWDGRAPWTVDLGEGLYQTLVEPVGKDKVRGKSFTVEATKKTCEYTFDGAAQSWTGGCK